MVEKGQAPTDGAGEKTTKAAALMDDIKPAASSTETTTAASARFPGVESIRVDIPDHKITVKGGTWRVSAAGFKPKPRKLL